MKEVNKKIELVKFQMMVNSYKSNKNNYSKWDSDYRFTSVKDIPELPETDEETYNSYYLPRLISRGAIEKKDLISSSVYLGKGKNTTIAKWNSNSEVFEYIIMDLNLNKVIESCYHFQDGIKNIFIPILLCRV